MFTDLCIEAFFLIFWESNEFIISWQTVSMSPVMLVTTPMEFSISWSSSSWDGCVLIIVSSFLLLRTESLADDFTDSANFYWILTLSILISSNCFFASKKGWSFLIPFYTFFLFFLSNSSPLEFLVLWFSAFFTFLVCSTALECTVSTTRSWF